MHCGMQYLTAHPTRACGYAVTLCFREQVQLEQLAVVSTWHVPLPAETFYDQMKGRIKYAAADRRNNMENKKANMGRFDCLKSKAKNSNANGRKAWYTRSGTGKFAIDKTIEIKINIKPITP